MRRFLRTLLLGVLLASVTAPAVYAIEPLNLADVPASDPDRAALEYLNRHDVLYGYLHGMMYPDRSVTRAEMLKIVLEATGNGDDALRAGVLSAPFSDVPASHTLAAYVTYAKQTGMVSGYPDGRYKPDATVARAEAMKIVTNAFEVFCPVATESPYRDIAASTLREDIRQAYDLRWFQPTGSSFMPSKPMLRREVATMIVRALAARATPNPGTSPGECSDRFYGETPPATTASDWKAVNAGTLRASAPAGWYAETRGDMIAVDPFVRPWASAGTEALFYLSSEPVDGTLNDAWKTEGAIRDYTEVTISLAGGAKQVVGEAVRVSDGWRFMRWDSNGRRYRAAFETPAAPGLVGVFYRFVQNAVALN